jgi:hypothetical protein
MLKSRTGIDYIEKDKIIRRWKEYIEELYKKDPNTSMYFQDQAYTQEPMVMKCEVRKALQEITGNKASSADDLPIELIKAAGEAAINRFNSTMSTDLGEHFVAPRVEQIYIFTYAEKRSHETVFQLQNHCINPPCE